MSRQPWQLTASQIVDAVQHGQLSASEVLESHLQRIDRVNPKVNALTVVFYERAREYAAALDARIALGERVGRLAGVPISIKENIDFTWSPTTEAATFLKDNVAPTDATLVQRLLDADAVPVARGNMPDFGLRWDTDNDLFGRTINPWDAERTPFGSSGGDAVAVATGMSAVGLGNDYGGSLRLPASAAGVCALRTSEGRVPAPVVAAAPVPLSLQKFAVNGPIARSVADLDLAFSVIHGADGRDPLAVTVDHPTGYDGPRRAAILRDPLGWGVEDGMAEAIDRAAGALGDAGWQIEEAEPPLLEDAARLWRRLSSQEMGGLFEPGVLPGPLTDGATQYFRDNVKGTELFDNVDAYVDAWARQALISSLWRQFQSRYPVMIGPVSTADPFPVGFDLSGTPATDELWRRHRLVVAVNFLGLPSVALPTHIGRNGLPYGVQVISPRFGEHIALAAASDVERELGAFTPVDPREPRE
ncbi:amidase family protein [Branchiibius cervicis]|uniref:Amidase family protein n=1 Tax=Branchiibius cervicis TaxID=908252 RepID=A0ABW2AU15_9MICO